MIGLTFLHVLASASTVYFVVFCSKKSAKKPTKSKKGSTTTPRSQVVAPSKVAVTSKECNVKSGLGADDPQLHSFRPDKTQTQSAAMNPTQQGSNEKPGAAAAAPPPSPAAAAANGKTVATKVNSVQPTDLRSVVLENNLNEALKEKEMEKEKEKTKEQEKEKDKTKASSQKDADKTQVTQQTVAVSPALAKSKIGWDKTQMTQHTVVSPLNAKSKPNKDKDPCGTQEDRSKKSNKSKKRKLTLGPKKMPTIENSGRTQSEANSTQQEDSLKKSLMQAPTQFGPAPK